MGWNPFKSKKKTTYYSNHISLVNTKGFKPYTNSLIMMSALSNDRYTSTADIIKDGIFNSPKRGLSRLFKYQAKALGRTAQLYSPSGDMVNFNYRPFLEIEPTEDYYLEDVEISFLEPQYYAYEWIRRNRPDLLVFIDDTAIEYNEKSKTISVNANNQKLSVPVKNVDPNRETLYVTYQVLDREKEEYSKDLYISSEIVKSFKTEEEGYDLIHNKSSNLDIILEKELKAVPKGSGINGGHEHSITYSSQKVSTRLVTLETRDVSPEEFNKGIIGKRINYREVVRFRTNKRTYEDRVNKVVNRFYRTVRRNVTVEQEVAYKEIQREVVHIVKSDTRREITKVLIYKQGDGIPSMDKLISSRSSLGYKASPMVVKYNEGLVSKNRHKNFYDFNNKSMKRFSSGTSDYSSLYNNLKGDALKDIKEGIIIFGCSFYSNLQFALEYNYKFFSKILDHKGIREGTTNGSAICKQSAGRLYYDPGIGNIVRKKHTGAYNSKYKLNKVYAVNGSDSVNVSTGIFSKKENRPYRMFILRTSPVTYETIKVYTYGQHVQSSLHWINHGVSGTEDKGNENAGVRIPLLESVIRSLPVKYAADVAKYSPSIILSTYQTVKIRWYQRSIFKFFLAAIMIAVSIAFPPAGGAMAAVAGTIGATVATYLSLSSITFLVMAHAVNMVIGAVVASVISSVVNKFIGGEIGQLISNIASMIAMGKLNGMSFKDTLGNMMTSLKEVFSVNNLLTLSNANTVINFAANQSIKSRVNELEKTRERINDLQRQVNEAQEKYDTLVGTNNNNKLLSTETLLNLTSGQDNLPSDTVTTAESPDSFLARTLMSGADIADTTLSLIYDYSTIELTKKNFLEGTTV